MSIQHVPLDGTDRLPAEVMAQILDSTKDNTQTLYACCLVSTGWHSYLIDSLYETIRLERRFRFDRLASAARIYPAVRDRLSLARSVILQHGYTPGFTHVFPLLLGPHLHRVQELTLHDCFGQSLHPSFFVTLPQLKNVKHLYLSGSPRSFVDFQRIVRAFPQLEELDIAGLKGPSWNASQLTPPHVLNLPCVSKLTCLCVSDRVPEFFRIVVAWLSSSGACSTIRRLDIFLFPSSSQESRNAFLAHTASTLEYLRMFIAIKSLNDHWGLPRFLRLRVLDITIDRSGNFISTKRIQGVFHIILASLTSPALEHVRLKLRGSIATAPSTQDMDSRGTTTDACRAQYADLHAVLARATFSTLHRVTVVLDAFHLSKLASTKNVALKWLDFLRALFAPWCVRGIANLACAITTMNKSWEVAVDKGEGPHYIDLRGRGDDFDTALQVVGFDT